MGPEHHQLHYQDKERKSFKIMLIKLMFQKYMGKSKIICSFNGKYSLYEAGGGHTKPPKYTEQNVSNWIRDTCILHLTFQLIEKRQLT